MARGRRAKPAAVKRAQGNPGKRALPPEPEPQAEEAAAEAQEAPAKFPAPPMLSKAAREIWTRLGPELSRLKFLRATDRDAFARYCEHLAEWWKQTRKIRREGTTYWSTSQHGKLRRLHPAFLVRERVEKKLEALEDRFGLTPRARYEITHRIATQGVLPFDRPDGGDQAGDDGEAAPPAGPIGFLQRSGSVH